MQKENKYLEYKEKITKSYLKTVSAFANYNNGEIIFGVSNDLNIVGIDDAINMCLNIENQINDSITPKPDFNIKINDDKTITLFVMKGLDTPYRYNGKAYKRNDTSTIEVDLIEEKRLILTGLNISFEELSINENLTFDYLGKKLIDILKLDSLNKDILKTLDLYNKDSKYNNAAKLLSDNNDFPGIDIVVFGENINIFKKRYTFTGESLVKQYYDAIDIFNNEYIFEEIRNGFREKKELIPFDAFREALANALVHRMWDVKANTKIEMHQDKIIISSPGGLVANMTKEDYVNGNYSYLRNPIIANVFRRLRIIEAFATGIKRINESYRDVILKPIFNVTDSAISVLLPVTKSMSLNHNEVVVLESMRSNYSYTRTDIEKTIEMSKDTLIRTLNSLIDKGLISKNGKAKATSYIKK